MKRDGLQRNHLVRPRRRLSGEVPFEQKEGTFHETDNDAIMEKVDQEGHVIGLSIPNVSQTKDQAPVPVTLRDVTT